MPEQTDRSIAVVRQDERGFAAAAHLLGAVPLWGFIFLAGIWIYFKERSREVVFHVQQAMVFQMMFLGVAVFALAVELLLMPVEVLSSELAELLSRANWFFFSACFVLYALTCLVGVVLTIAGKPFLYPIAGKRILESGGRKTMPEV